MIRKSRLEDLEDIEEIYAYARSFMKENGNSSQWKDDRPKRESLVRDIEKGIHYIIEIDGKVLGVFTFLEEEDPFYAHIDGAWLNDEPYGTIHKIASNGIEKGVFKMCLDFVKKINPNIRIDTHKDNKPMLSAIEKAGFKNCGIVRVDDGTERIAFQKKFR